MKYSYLAALACVAVSAPAAAQTYFGENLSPGYTVTGAPLTARNNFAAQLSGVSTEDFTGFATGSSPATLTFNGSAGAINATFSPGGGTVVSGITGGGRWPTSATQHFEVTSRSFGISFSTAVAAFGFYGTDIGDFNGSLTLTLRRTGQADQLIVVPHTVNGNSDSLLFYGLIDTANPFNEILFGNTNAGTDIFGFDDMIVGDARQVTGGVPEPSTWAMLILGFGAVGATLRRRQQAAKLNFA